jgi:predicted aldo/keto reductase-like oxidoreductase
MPTNFDTADKAYDAVRRSLDRLGVECLDFYHVWCLRKMEHYELAVRPGGQLEGLQRCRDEGLIRHIVCSTHQPGNEVAHILSKDEFEGVLLGVNILNFPYRLEGLLAARERGCGVVAMNPLAGGAIPRHAAEFAFLARPGETATDAALRFVIGNPWIDIALVGFTTREHVEQACRAADVAEPLDDAEISRLRGLLGENLNEMCTACGYCKGCPEQIPVAAYMQIYNNKILFGKNDDGMREQLVGERSWGLLVGRRAAAGACVACGKCEDACTQHLPIIDRLREIAAWESE